MKSSVKPPGHLAGPLLVFGSVSLVLGFAVEFLGVFRGAEEALLSVWKASGREFQLELGATSPLGILIGAAVCYGLTGAILGSPGIGRRLILGSSTFALGLALMPVLAVWGIFWKPFGLGLMILWAWFSAMIYAQGHRMPCDGAEGEEADNVISMDGKLSPKVKGGRANG